MQEQYITQEGVQDENNLFSGEVHFSKTANELKVIKLH